LQQQGVVDFVLRVGWCDTIVYNAFHTPNTSISGYTPPQMPLNKITIFVIVFPSSSKYDDGNPAHVRYRAE
jgi:hypothetical protein